MCDPETERGSRAASQDRKNLTPLGQRPILHEFPHGITELGMLVDATLERR